MGRRHYHPHVLREETKVQRLGQSRRGRIGTGWSRFQVWAITPCTKQPTAQGGGTISPRRESLCIFTKKRSNEVLSSYPWQNMSSSLNTIFGFLSVAGLEDSIGTQLSESWSRQMIKHGICEK